jgi:Ca-activated chloride channel family protein
VSALAWSAALAVLALAGIAALRGRRELVTWLGRDPAPFARPARALCLALCAALVAAALVRALETPVELSGAGADVVIAIDTSTSMEVTDSAPSRLRRALRTAERVAQEAEGVRLGLVVFAGEAFVALPLTQDRDALLTYVRALDGETVSVRGSELGRGLAAAARAFDPRSSRPRTLLLLSDGEHNGPPFDAELAALAALSVRVVAVGYGTAEGGAVPGQLALAEAVRRGEATLSRREDATLRRIAAATDGAYFRELEERPSPADLLPPREARDAPPPQDPRDPLRPLLVAAGLALALELLLSGGSFAFAGARRRRRALAGAASAVVLAGASFGPASSWLAEGDAALAAGRAEEALALYREAERTRAGEARVQIRIGNALFRLARTDQAASAYLEALRVVAPDDGAARFAASFNLGNTLVAQKHFEEARDAYWAALVAEPASREAKFNYEWTLERLREEPPVPESDTSQEPSERERESEEPEPSPSADGQGRADPRPARDGLDEQEAQRWLATLEEPVGEALRQQVTNEFDAKPRARPGGKTW